MSVGVEGVNLNDRDVFGRVLHDGWVVHRLGGVRRVVVHILHIDVDLYEGGERHHAAVAGIHRQPVVRHRLTVQQLQSADHTWVRERVNGLDEVLFTQVLDVNIREQDQQDQATSIKPYYSYIQSQHTLKLKNFTIYRCRYIYNISKC